MLGVSYASNHGNVELQCSPASVVLIENSFCFQPRAAPPQPQLKNESSYCVSSVYMSIVGRAHNIVPDLPLAALLASPSIGHDILRLTGVLGYMVFPLENLLW